MASWGKAVSAGTLAASVAQRSMNVLKHRLSFTLRTTTNSTNGVSRATFRPPLPSGRRDHVGPTTMPYQLSRFSCSLRLQYEEPKLAQPGDLNATSVGHIECHWVFARSIGSCSGDGALFDSGPRNVQVVVQLLVQAAQHCVSDRRSGPASHAQQCRRSGVGQVVVFMMCLQLCLQLLPRTLASRLSRHHHRQWRYCLTVRSANRRDDVPTLPTIRFAKRWGIVPSANNTWASEGDLQKPGKSSCLGSDSNAPSL